LPQLGNLPVLLQQLYENFGTRITVTSASHEHTFCQVRPPFRGQEISMEIAALVLFSSVALWFAEEISGNLL
jgi:hypothetical protein